MHVVYYAWVLQHISEIVGLFFPKELIILIADSMRSIIIKYHADHIDMDHITIIPVQNNKSHLYYDTDDLLLKTNQFIFCGGMCKEIRYEYDEKPGYILFNLPHQNECIYLRKFVMNIDTLMQSNKIKTQLFGEKCNTYHSCITFSNKNCPDRIKMILCKEIKLIEMIDNREESVTINSVKDITKIITGETLVEFVYSLRIFLKPPTYGIYPEIKIIRFKYVDSDDFF